MTEVSLLSKADFNNLNLGRQELYTKSINFPGGISYYYLNAICSLLKQGKYSWGTSRRIYIDKPGQPEKKRPLTIPPFADRLVQKAIELVLHSIYEPIFERTNVSFGFRPNKGTHDALMSVLSRKNGGMVTAIEGDIDTAYDSVHKISFFKF